MLRSVLCFCLLGLLGCGPSGPATGTVRGKVTIGGKAPTETVRVNYINSIIGQGGGATADAEGNYVLDQRIRVGEYTVYFEKVVDSSKGPVSTAQETLQTIPKEYRNEQSSPLKQTVKAGANTLDIDIPAS